MKILRGNSPEFKKYGRIIDNVDFSSMISELEKIEITEGVTYFPSIEALEKTASYEQANVIFGGEMDLEAGYCGGHNSVLNALEYHRSSEVNVFATDAILMIGLQQDIEDGFKYDTNKVECFLFEKGEACEVYATTLHYAPCGVDNAGFMVGVILPRGTNEALTTEHAGVGEDKLLTARNKWLIAHPDAKSEEGHFMGLYGTNWDLNKD